MSDPMEILNRIPDLGYAEPAVEINTDEFVKTVESRRSVRVFDSTPIPENVVRKCLNLALLAPNSSNLQATEFYWVKSPEKKRLLVDFCFGQPAARTAAELFVCVARTKTWRQNARQMLEAFKSQKLPVPQSALVYYKTLVPFMYYQGPFSLFGLLKKIGTFVAGFKKPVPREPFSHSEMKVWAAKSASLACENLMLAFRAFGFDTCPMEGLDSKKVRRLLGLPRDAFVVMAVSAGKRAPNGVYGPRLRFPKEQFIFEI